MDSFVTEDKGGLYSNLMETMYQLYHKALSVLLNVSYRTKWFVYTSLSCVVEQEPVPLSTFNVQSTLHICVQPITGLTRGLFKDCVAEQQCLPLDLKYYPKKKYQL